MKREFKVGDKVFDSRFGKGVGVPSHLIRIKE